MLPFAPLWKKSSVDARLLHCWHLPCAQSMRSVDGSSDWPMSSFARLMPGLRLASFASAVVSSALMGCGGGDIEHWVAPIDFDDLFGWYYGSIALNPETFAASITANQPGQETSDAKAIDVCGGGSCTIVLRYSGQGVCGALSWAGNREYGVGTGSSKEDAMAKALDQCQAQGGLNCEPALAACNGS